MFGKLFEVLWCGRYLFGLCWEDVIQCDVRGVCCKGDINFYIIVSRDVKMQFGLVDSVQIGGFQIFLFEMYVIGLMFNCQLLVIVNEQLGVIVVIKGDGGDYVIFYFVVVLVFDV